MGENFTRFKKKAFKIVLAKSILSLVFAGGCVSGTLLLLLKLKVIGLSILSAALIGVGCSLLAAALTFLLLMPRDVRLSKTLDETLGLEERVRTMVSYLGEDGEMYRRQRADTELALSRHSTKELKPRFLWVYIAAAVISLATLVVSMAVPDMRNIDEPVEKTPFELSAMQAAAMEELISYVDKSAMEEPYRTDIGTALEILLDELRLATTEEEMHASLATALTVITSATYDSSSETEICEALFKSGSSLLTVLAEAIDTSEWDDRTEEWWGMYAEGYNIFSMSAEALSSRDAEGNLFDEADMPAKLKWLLEEAGLRLSAALDSSGIDKSDALYVAVSRMISGDSDAAGIAAISSLVDGLGYADALAAVKTVTDGMTVPLYDVLSVTKTNSNVGEYVLKKLSALFGAVIPPFERPDLKKDSSSDGDREEGSSSGGGVGEGVEFGSNDLVLDPLTGEYVTYGTLYAKYNTLMLDKLSSGKYAYTDAQKRAIEKYFALLYSGLKDEE